jgi:hypothetical protein
MTKPTGRLAARGIFHLLLRKLQQVQLAAALALHYQQMVGLWLLLLLPVVPTVQPLRLM